MILFGVHSWVFAGFEEIDDADEAVPNDRSSALFDYDGKIPVIRYISIPNLITF